MEPDSSPNPKSNDSFCEFDKTIDKIMDVTTMVTQIDSLELTMKLMLA